MEEKSCKMKYKFANKITEPLYGKKKRKKKKKKRKKQSHYMKLGKCSEGKKINQNTVEKMVLSILVIYKIDDFSAFCFMIWSTI